MAHAREFEWVLRCLECGQVVVRLCLVVVVVGLQSGCGRVVVKLQSVQYLKDPREFGEV